MIKYSLRYILWKHDKNRFLQYPIYLRITINRQTKYIASGIFVGKKSWEPKSELIINHGNADELNADLFTRKQTIIRAIVERQLKKEQITSGQIKELFSGNKNMHDFFQFADQFIMEVKSKRAPGMIENYNKVLNKVEQFNSLRSLYFEEITHDFLVRFETWLRESLSENYVHAIWKILKTFFNAARKRGLITHYPFSSYDNPKYNAPDKDYLTLAEIKEIEKIADRTKDHTVKQSAVYFLLGCYSGLRVSDWYRFDMAKHIRNGELLLRAKKNKEWVTMPVHKALKKNFDRMKELKLTISDVEINRTLKDIAKMIGCNKKITCHTSRHSFAITMCLNRGLSSEVAAELMGINLSTFVNNYSQITRKKIFDEAIKAWKNI